MKEGLILKQCPKCGGSVYLDRDYHGWYEECLQCGYIRDLEIIVEVREKITKNNPDKQRKTPKSDN